MSAEDLSALGRQANIAKMQAEPFDLAVIGGGITGAGVARDAASRGMKVALIEAKDFASGTSSRSSKLIHGGIRYLENLQLGLVFEALSERQKLFTMAPHLVHPLRFLIPVFKTGRVPAWKMGLGMWAYDALSLFEAPELHTYLTPHETKSEFPLIRFEELTGAFSYSDAYMDDDRLVHETMRSASLLGAVCANYVEATSARFQNGKVSALECTDQTNGHQFTIHARHVISSVGPWTDLFGAKLLEKWKRILRPTKGVHLTFDRKRFPLRYAVVMGAETRIVFAIPRNDMVIVGTTDTEFIGDPAAVKTDHEDVSYLLKVIENYFPGAKIRREDILGCYAGVRPLIDDGAVFESKTSREHRIWTDSGCTFVAGGKYTTYRNMARQTVEAALEFFPVEDRALYSRSYTDQPLNALVSGDLFQRAQVEAGQIASAYQLPVTLCARLFTRHGLEAEHIIKRALTIDLPAVQGSEEWMWCAEAIHAVESTMCIHLRDFYYQRTPLVLSRGDHGKPFQEMIAQTMGSLLGWSATEREEEINALQNQIAQEMSAVLSS